MNELVCVVSACEVGVLGGVSRPLGSCAGAAQMSDLGCGSGFIITSGLGKG